MYPIHTIILAFICLTTINPSQGYDQCRVKLDLSVCSVHNPDNFTFTQCKGIPLCRKHFRIEHVDHKPFSSEILLDFLRICCGDCLNSTVSRNVTKVSHITDELMSSTNFLFPILGNKDADQLYGYRFLPLLETPSVYFVTYKENNLVLGLILSCLNMWPLFLICALMVVISGFLCWLVEMSENKEQFPRSFASGWFEGIWWSFISMTTVGYGDKTPKSVTGRLLSIIWIIVGITSFSLITATLTSEIVAANSVPPPTLANANVGAIRGHTYEGMLVAKRGGILIDIDPPNMMEGIHQLIEMMDNKTIDGFLLDRYELMLFYKYFQNDTKYGHDVEYLRGKTVLTQLHPQDEYLYGALVKDEEDYQFLESFARSNRDIINSCTRLFLSVYSREVRVAQKRFSLFSTEGEMFWPSFVACSVAVMFCIVYGLLHELKRKKRACKDGLKITFLDDR